MPKPVKKTTPKSVPKATKKRTTAKPSSDPNRRAHQMMAEHLEKFETSAKPWDSKLGTTTLEPETTPPHGDTFKAQLSAHMAAMGRKGGKVSGAKRMENLSDRKRKEIAKKAAAARWTKRQTSS